MFEVGITLDREADILLIFDLFIHVGETFA